MRGSTGIVLDLRPRTIREDGGTPERWNIDVDAALEGRHNPSSASTGSWRPSAGLLPLLVAGHVCAFQGYELTKWQPLHESCNRSDG